MSYIILRADKQGSRDDLIEVGLAKTVNEFIKEKHKKGEKWIPTGGPCILIPRSGNMGCNDLTGFQALIKVW